MRFMSTDAGTTLFSNPSLTSTNDGTKLFESGNWAVGNVVSAGKDLGFKLPLFRWNSLSWVFSPTDGGVEFTFNGAKQPSFRGGPERHPGALQLGGGNNFEGYITDVKLSQP